MLLNIITRVAADTGIDLVQQRNILVSIFNAASKIFHHELDSNKMYREVTLVVPPDKVISLPSYIGEVKGLRVHSTEMLVPLNTINIPRYSNSTLLYKIKNWRDLGDSAICQNLSAQAPFTITVSSVESTPVTLYIAGQTPYANRLEEALVINGTNLNTLNAFGPRIDQIACFDPRTVDITILDSTGYPTAVLGTDQQRTRYKLMDVSQIFWPMNDTVEGNSFIDVCYKLPFKLLYNNTDSFAMTDDYDEALYHMCMHLHYLTQGGKEQMAMNELQRATQLLKASKDGTEMGVQKKLNWGRNKFYSIFTRGRHRLSGNDYGMYFADLVDY
jgi:hypothetical protein